MTIDKEKLISLLKDKTGLEREQVEAQLSELIDRIQKAANEGKTFEIEGFGTFSMEEGVLQFEPEDTLETEINNKYAGMKPIELIGAFKEPEKEEEVPDADMRENLDEDEKWAFDTEAAEDSRDQKEEKPVEETISEEHQEPEEVPVLEDLETTDLGEEDVETVFGTAADTKEKEVDTSEKASSPDEESKEESPSGVLDTVVVAAVIVLAVALGGWLIYDMSFSGSDGTQSIATSEKPVKETSSENDTETSQSTTPSGKDEENEREPKESSQVPIQQEANGEPINKQQNRYGLHGDPNRDLSNGYTIVVHSLRNQQKAEQNRQQLQETGFRALISQAQVQGTTYYRVGIGQFETVDDAQQAIDDIPARYRESNFIKRIQ